MSTSTRSPHDASQERCMQTYDASSNVTVSEMELFYAPMSMSAYPRSPPSPTPPASTSTSTSTARTPSELERPAKIPKLDLHSNHESVLASEDEADEVGETKPLSGVCSNEVGLAATSASPPLPASPQSAPTTPMQENVLPLPLQLPSPSPLNYEQVQTTPTKRLKADMCTDEDDGDRDMLDHALV